MSAYAPPFCDIILVLSFIILTHLMGVGWVFGRMPLSLGWSGLVCLITLHLHSGHPIRGYRKFLSITDDVNLDRSRQDTRDMKREATSTETWTFTGFRCQNTWRLSDTTAYMVSKQTTKIWAEIKYLETIHSSWLTVNAQQACAVWTVWVLNSQWGTPRSWSETVKTSKSINLLRIFINTHMCTCTHFLNSISFS